MMLALAAIHDWEIDQMDVVTAFLNPEVDRDVYMALPQGVESGCDTGVISKPECGGIKRVIRLLFDNSQRNNLRSCAWVRW